MLLEFRYEFGDRAQQPPEESLTPFGIEEYGPVAEGQRHAGKQCLQ